MKYKWRKDKMAETSNFGILTNTSNIYDAVDNRNAATTEIIHDSKYNNGTAIKAVGTNQLMFDTGVIPAGTFSGTYDIGIFYDDIGRTAQGQQLMRWAIYEDGVLMPEDTGTFSGGSIYMYDMNTVEESWKYGLHTTLKLNAASTYQIKITTSGSIGSRTAILDYVSLARAAENAMIWGRPNGLTFGARNQSETDTWADNGSQLTIDVIHGTMNGPWAVDTMYSGAPWGFTYSAPFKSIIGAWPTMYCENNGTGAAHGQLLATVDSIDIPNNQVDCTIRNVSNTAISSTAVFQIKILVVGFI
jgi:hypothetical protein